MNGCPQVNPLKSKYFSSFVHLFFYFLIGLSEKLDRNTIEEVKVNSMNPCLVIVTAVCS